MRTREVADRAGVNTQTLRYYERRGLLPEPPRQESGYRIYAPETVRIVHFVKRAQQLGFSLDEVESLLELADGGPENCDAARQLARSRLSELDRRISDLRAMRDSLDRLLATCSLPPGRRECPLLSRLAGNPAERIVFLIPLVGPHNWPAPGLPAVAFEFGGPPSTPPGRASPPSRRDHFCWTSRDHSCGISRHP